MNTFMLKIYAADRIFLEEPCESVVVPMPDGLYGIQAGHHNMISALEVGTLEYTLPGQEKAYAAVSKGVVKVEENEVLILADTVERPEEIDINRAKREAEEAREAILQKRSFQEYVSAEARLQRTMGRLKAARRKIIN